MGRTFVMGDIHGMYKALRQCLERSGFDDEVDTLIQLGDVVDRGPETFEVVERLLAIKHLIAIRGNHDDWARIWLTTGTHPGRMSGGDATVASYTKHCALKDCPDYWQSTGLEIPDDHVKFFLQTQKNWHMDQRNNIYVHGGFDRHLHLVEQKEDWIFYWDRDLWHSALSYKAMNKNLVYHDGTTNIVRFKIKELCKEVFIGHTPTILWGEEKPMDAGPIWNIDTGAGMRGRLTIMDVDTKQFWQSDNVIKLYENEGGSH